MEGSKVGICICCTFAIDNSNLTNYNYYSPNGDLHYIFKLTLIIADQVSKCQDLWNGQFCIQTSAPCPNSEGADSFDYSSPLSTSEGVTYSYTSCSRYCSYLHTKSSTTISYASFGSTSALSPTASHSHHSLRFCSSCLGRPILPRQV